MLSLPASVPAAIDGAAIHAAGPRGKLRVLAVLPTLARGGAEVQLIHLLAALPSETVERQLVTLLSLDAPRSLEARVRGAELPWLDLAVAPGAPRPMGVRHALQNLLRARAALARAITAFEPDVVYTRLWYAGLAVASLNRRKLGFRHVVNEEAALVNDDDPGAAKRALRRLVVAQADAWVVPTLGLHAQFVAAGARPARGRVIYNATPMPDAPPPPRLPGPTRFAAMGRLAPTKGFDRLLEACRLVKARGLPFSVDVAGEGPDRAELEARARALGVDDVVRFVGYAADPLEFLQQHDAFVLTSRDEGFANVIAEAMACWLPTVSFDIDFGPRELVVPGATGFLVADGDLEGFAERMSELARDPALRARQGQAARERALARFSVPSMARQFAALFEAVAAGHPSGGSARTPTSPLPASRPARPKGRA